ncbi:MAG TPA: ABC-F family ATP-binding cassette domain-containing protein [Chloroflexota bacterium]|nr:ABC-F family ATP-binding cassette domain-containing protein [Chloroflexota bacterium]
MLRVSNLTKYFADRAVLRGVSFLLAPGERAGLVGANGSGKSTLLAIIAGLLAPDAGSVMLGPRARVGYLRQGYLGDETRPVAELLGPGGAVLTAHLALQEAAEALGADGISPELLARYEHAAIRFEDQGGYAMLTRVEEALRGLDLEGIDPARPAATLSGGQKTRLALAALLLDEPDVLLLDEPTNHLDIDGLRWLEQFLNGYHGTALIVSHDRAFLDATVTTILELDGEIQTVTAYAGGYSAYAAARQAALQDQWDRYQRQERERARVEVDIRQLKDQALRTEQRSRADYDHGDTRGKKAASKARAAKGARKALVRERKLEKRLETDTVEKPRAGWKLKLDFAPVEGGAREVLRVDDVGKTYDGIPVLRAVNLLVRHGERLAITGPNGGGKSTLLKIVAGQLSADAGLVRLGANVVPGYYSQEQEELDPRQTPLEVVRGLRPMDETEARTLLHAYLFSGDAVFTPIERLSYGERARLVLARLIISRANLLLLDEPTNHLDIPARERFEAALSGFSGTMIAVLHDRYAISRLATRVLELREGTLRELAVPEAVDR